jgi:hypothetical protein
VLQFCRAEVLLLLFRFAVLLFCRAAVLYEVSFLILNGSTAARQHRRTDL